MFFFFVTILGLPCSVVYCSDRDEWDCPPNSKLFDLPDGTQDCIYCPLCPRGHVKVANCSPEHETICEPCYGHSYYDDNTLNCRLCSQCLPGTFIKSVCSQFNDSKCEPCPHGTFSSDSNSNSCTMCNDCSGEFNSECNSTRNAICKESGPLGIVIGSVFAAIAVLLIIVVVIYTYMKGLFCWPQQTNIRGAAKSASKREDTEDPFSHESLMAWHRQETENAAEMIEKQPVHDQVDFKELKQKQLERERKLIWDSTPQQLKILSPSVGFLVCPKPLRESPSEDDQNTQKMGLNKLAVCRVGTKYIMTSYFPVRDICGISEKGDLNHSIFEDKDVYVTFEKGMKFKIRASRPSYTNTVLDIIVLEIYDPSVETSSSGKKTEIIPPSFCLHTSISFDKVKRINVITFDKNMENKLQDRGKTLIKSKTSSLEDASKYLSDHADYLNKVINKRENDDFVKRSIYDLAAIGQTKVCWETDIENACAGSPGIIYDNEGCRILCICTGKVPKMMDDLSVEDQTKFESVKSIRIGTLISEVYTTMKAVNPTLAMELFYELNDDQYMQ